MALFDRLLAGETLERVVASEGDGEIREAARNLWIHHGMAARENFLGDALDFEVLPVFVPGHVLVNRFRIERKLGSGGMGEVYLASDNRMEERVAIKTIPRLLAPSPPIRRRFVSEVQNARRVTHPNICRIHELFEDGETVFFSMEYLQGPLLSEMLAEQSFRPDRARLIVRQLAEGLHSAHQKGVVHGDFKPGNVIVISGPPERPVIMDFGLARALDRAAAGAEVQLSLRAGSVDFMAPELHTGAAPSVRSDIYAFGKVAQALLPNERMWGDCTRPAPRDRPHTLAPIIRRLEPSHTRRYLITGIGLASAGAAGYSLLPFRRKIFTLPYRARLLINGFRAAAGELSGATLARSILITALRQSPQMNPIADQELMRVLRRLKDNANLPIAGRLLLDLLAQLRAAFWLDAEMRRAGSRYSLDLRVLRSSDREVVAEFTFRDVPGLGALAQQAALWLRRAAGESGPSIASSSAAVSSYTSRVPEALEKYYDGMDHYAVAEMELARPLFEEAVRLDPQFAQAHSMLGMTLNPARRCQEAFEEAEIAYRLAGNLPPRERGWIAANYYSLTNDPERILASARANVDYFPDDPRFHRNLGQSLWRVGDTEGAVTEHRRALDLAPGDDLHEMDYIDSLTAAGRFDEALKEFQIATGRGVRNRWIYISGGSALMGLERYEEAIAAFGMEPEDRSKYFDMAGARVMLGDLEGALAAVTELGGGSHNAVETHRTNEFLCGLYYLMDRPREAQPLVRRMADLPVCPPMARFLDCTAFWAFHVGDDAALAMVQERMNEIVLRWPGNAYTEAVAEHAGSLKAWRAGSLSGGAVLEAVCGKAYSIWTVFNCAEYLTRGNPKLAEQYWARADAHRGDILELWFPGLLLMLWMGRAAAAQERGDRRAAAMYSKKVLDHWSRSNPGLRVTLAARAIYEANRST